VNMTAHSDVALDDGDFQLKWNVGLTSPVS
jgi:hypothetical protein